VNPNFPKFPHAPGIDSVPVQLSACADYSVPVDLADQLRSMSKIAVDPSITIYLTAETPPALADKIRSAVETFRKANARGVTGPTSTTYVQPTSGYPR
jgi:hypothetical protein